MSYYDEDTGEYVGYDPIEEHDRRVHREQYHKSEVPTVQELLGSKISRDYIEQSKKFKEEPVCESNDFHEQYMHGFEKVFYDVLGDLPKAIELSAKDHNQNKGQVRLWSTSKEHIVPEGTETYIVYRVGCPDEVIGVFFKKEDAVQYRDLLNGIINEVNKVIEEYK